MPILLSTLWTSVSYSGPKDPQNYLKQAGGFVDLVDGSYVQGSVSHGGLQPDYQIDLQDSDLQRFLQQVKKAVSESDVIRDLEMRRETGQANLKKIELVTALIQKALPGRSYTSGDYLAVLSEHRMANKDISLGAYLRCQVGVCREFALITHFALKAVGIENKYVYIKVQLGTYIEDHAVVVIEDRGEKWIIDPYNTLYHGRSFADLTKGSAALAHPRSAPYAKASENYAIIVEINKYPLYWSPKPRCDGVFR